MINLDGLRAQRIAQAAQPVSSTNSAPTHSSISQIFKKAMAFFNSSLKFLEGGLPKMKHKVSKGESDRVTKEVRELYRKNSPQSSFKLIVERSKHQKNKSI